MLVLVRRDKSATVYINELQILAEVQATRAIRAGEAVLDDDVADVRALKFRGVEIPDDVGVLFAFSMGWRRALYYDFGPFAPGIAGSRTYDIWAQLGQCWAYLTFQQLLKVTPEEWELLLHTGWFLFIGIPVRYRKQLLNYVRSGWDVDELLGDVSKHLKRRLPRLLDAWATNPCMRDHLPLLQSAVERYQEEDNVSCNCILYPRIEGILRSFFSGNATGRPSQKSLVNCAVSGGGSDLRETSLLLPRVFRRYLNEVYFANFDPARPSAASRNSVAHGVVPADQLSLKAATLALLIVEQLFYFLRPKQKCEPAPAGLDTAAGQ